MTNNKRNDLIKKCKVIIEEKFDECPFDKRPALFKKLEEWAYSDLSPELCEVFISALYDCKKTKDAQMVISLDKALSCILGRK